MQVAKWGNSLAVRIPKDVASALQLKEGDEVDIVAAAGKALELARRPTREELLERLKSFRGLLPADYKFDRDEANAR